MALTTVQSGMMDSVAQYYTFKNRIINGGMVIDQRNAGASVTPINTQYLVDRFLYFGSQASKFTSQQNAGSVTPPVGFKNYLGFTSTSAYSVTATDFFLATQRIEGLNTYDLAWGTANAATVTLSFWVRSSLTGTFGGSLRNAAANRYYIFSYTISSANTWEQKTITISGDTTGTWNTDNGVGIEILWGMGVGSTYSITAGSWGSTAGFSPTGATSVVGTNGATFYITGVQLEEGVTATSFDYRPYGTELSLCQRYYEKSYDMDVVPGTATTTGSINLIRADGSGGLSVPFTVAKRATPTVTVYATSDGTAGQVRDNAAGVNRTATIASIGQRNAVVAASAAAVNAGFSFHYTSSAEL
jgi:hypothetical protein